MPEDAIFNKKAVRQPPNKSLKDVASPLDSLQRRMLRILRAVSGCPLALRYTHFESATMFIKLFLTIVVICFSSFVLSAESERECTHPLFKLAIYQTFDGEHNFTVCRSGSNNESEMLEKFMGNESSASLTLKYKISEADYNKILSLLDRAMESNLKDNTLGLDGSTWCLETEQYMSYRKLCYWTPSVDKEKRGISGLYELGEFVWHIAGSNKHHKELY